MLKYIFILFLSVSYTQAQYIKIDEPVNYEQVRSNNIKSISVTQFIYNDDGSSFKDSRGFKKYFNVYDRIGRLTEQVKYHIIEPMTIKEKYVYNNSGNISEKLKYNSAGSLIQHIKYKYDKNGFLRSEKYTAYANTVYKSMHYSFIADIGEDSAFSILQRMVGIEPPVQSFTITVNINDDDELNRYVVIGDEKDASSLRIAWSDIPSDIQRTLLTYDSSTKKDINDKAIFIDRIVYKTDTAGNIISRKIINTSGKILSSESYAYNEKNNVSHVNHFNSSGGLKYSVSYTYDSLGNNTEIVTSSDKMVYNYDPSGRLFEVVHNNPSGSISSTDEFIYNDAGQLAEIHDLDADKNIITKTTYTYNERGLISEITNYRNGITPYELIKFDYSYYN